jgi:UDP-glucuronate 4-epimerase
MKTILLTGVAGFIGSSLAEKIIDNYEIVGIDNFNDYYNPGWKEENIKPFLNHGNFKLYRVDIRNLEDLGKIFEGNKIDKIVHLAARAGVRPSIEQPILYEEVNVKGTLNLLEMAREFDVKHFVGASSSSVYGNQEKIPFSESDPVNEPISPYAATKKSGEMLCYTYAKLYGIKTSCLRFFTVYGPKGRPDMAPYIFTKALIEGGEIKKFGDGNSERDYTYIDDIVTGIEKLIEEEFDFEIFNLGNNKPVSLNDFIDLLEKITDKKANIVPCLNQPGDVRKTYADIDKAKKLLDWEPRTSLEEGLKNFVSWYRENRL